MKKNVFTVIAILIAANVAAQQLPYSQQMAQTAMNIWPDSFAPKPGKPARWSYDQGVILKGIEAVWKLYGDGKYFEYIRHSMDFYVREDGSIKDYKKEEYNIDHLNNGKAVMTLYDVTGKTKYKKAVDLLRSQLDEHPRTKQGSFWHKKIYPWQVWLDGLYMGQPFYAEYAMHHRQDTAFDDIARQFVWIEQHTRDNKTGLLYHGWDESREQKWADKVTGCSPHFWARALGWYGVALVDVLDYFPANHPGRKDIIGIINRLVKAVVKVQDAPSGLWYDIVDLPNRPKNYKEASASCMLVYTIAKAVRKGYIPASYLSNAQKGYDGIIKEFIEVDDKGQTNLKGTVSVSGLGGKPYRDGSFDYYMSEPVVVNDPKGVGAFIMCSAEMEQAALPKTGKGKNVVLDNWFNNEWQKNRYGWLVRRHYTWDDTDQGGFSLFGHIWNSYGAVTSSLDVAPTAKNLKNASVYIIVDPDGWKDTKQPNYMDDKAAAAIAQWVKRGGVLLLMTNDSANCDLAQFNKLATKFGIRFTDKSRNMVQGKEFETGAIYNKNDNPVFTQTKKMYLKEISTLEVKAPAKPLIEQDGEVIFATAKFGKGTVLAVGDPWIYNEYLDGRKIPAAYENFLAANEMVQWLLAQATKKK
ncbi:MAG TPA: glycoside hydrolase family 88 protein [Ferruginibacter sp.]|nr:glycoside hydrolase family 88 protein [Ferruginibacter sp.]HMP20551.1 glycoside hydrolase family 88 protein [Ferruginibacter sp.]